MSINDLKFKHPFTCIIAGTTSSGKTYIARRLLENWNLLIDTNLKSFKVLWCYGQMQVIYNQPIANIEIIYHKGIPTEEIIDNIKPNLIVLDDLMENVKTNNTVTNLFTKKSHHMNISVIFIVQNLFNKEMRTISLNSHYILVMKGVRITQQVGILGRQIFPSKSKEIMRIFKDATNKPFGYLLFDLHPQSSEEFRLRTRIFREEVPKQLRNKHTIAPIYFKLD